MGSRTYTREELDAALASMGVTDQTDVSRYGSGHINDTFKVETRRGTRFVLQRVNTDIFEPVSLKRNIIRVTEFLKSKGVKSLEVLGYENPWRLYAFLEGYTSRDVVEEPRQAYDVARAFAKFQNDCADIPPPRLDDIIPKFHDTPDRMRQLDEAVKRNYEGRLANVGPEMAFVESWRANASRIVDLMAKGDIRVEDGKIVIAEEGSAQKFVDSVQQITFAGQYARPDQTILYVTERCVLQLIDGVMTVIEVAPGVDLEKDIFPNMGFKPAVSPGCKEMDPAIFREEWGGLGDALQA